VLVRSHLNADVFRRHRVRFVVVPAAVLAALVLSTRAAVVTTVIVVFWDVYHSALQTFGLARIYDRLRGNDPDAGRRLDLGLNLVLYIGPLVAGATLAAHLEKLELLADVGATFFAQVPVLATSSQRILAWTAMAVGTAYVAFYIAAYVRLARLGHAVSPQKVFLLAATGLCSLWVWGVNPWGQAFFIMNLFHAVQYLALVWWSEGRGLRRLLRLDRARMGRGAAVVAFLVPLYAYGLVAESVTDDARVLWSLTQVVALMHFFYDGFIWSVRKGDVLRHPAARRRDHTRVRHHGRQIMPVHPMFRSILVAALLSSSALPACCKKTGSEVTAESIATDDGITEQSDAGTVSWAVAPDGNVKASIKAPGGAAVDKSATGSVTARALPSGAPVTAKLVHDDKLGLFTAALPRLDAELTEVKYEITVGGKTTRSVMFLPRGGTAELIASGKAASGKTLKATKGPAGGVVQVVGDDIIEIVADQKTGETRVYVLDDDLKPIAVGKRRVKLAVVAGSPEVVELTVDPSGGYFTGKLAGKSNPSKLTVVLHGASDGAPVVVLCGWAPGSTIVVGSSAHVHPIYVTAFTPVVVVNQPVQVVHKGKGKGKARGHHKK
jgi:hypothetical protein